ncbi:MAG TPA: dihydroorotase [Actinomycetota bacterium]|nr:dihydroorotase [Actinomycetota bacterium]
MSSFILRGGRVIDPVSGTDVVADVVIEGSMVKEIGATPGASAEVIDVSGAVVCPGFVDMHVHLREPGREDEETIASGSAAAALGGFTAICAMPNTDPVCDNAAIAEKVAAQGRLIGLADVFPAGAITKGSEGLQLAPIGEMVRSRAAVRIFTDDGRGVQDARLLRRAMEYMRGFDVICAEHCEDSSLSEGGQMHEGEFSDLLGLKGIPAEAEEVALARDLALARMTGVRFHAMHVSTAGSVELIRRAKAQGVQVTAEVTPHHLSLTDAELVSYNPNLKVNPPLRSASDVEALRRGVADGTIDVIATDHAPHAPEEKESEFESAPPGMLGLQTALGIMVGGLVGAGVVDLVALVALMSSRPAQILRIPGHGKLAIGEVANIVVFDPEAVWTVDDADFASPVRNSPWIGKQMKGRVIHTIHDGDFTVRDGALMKGAFV